MKKSVSIVLAIMLVFALLLVNAPLQAQAKQMKTETPTPNTLIAEGSWSAGNYLDVSKMAASAPTWLQLLADGVKVAEAGKICHPLRGGQFGWVGMIMQYKDGKWVKLTTTNDWVPNKEGQFMSCAQASSAGTYALFGYWVRPAGYVDAPAFDCSTLDWSGVGLSIDTDVIFRGTLASMPNTSILIEYAGYSGTALTDATGEYFWSPGITYTSEDSFIVKYTELTHNCVYTKTHYVA